VFGFGRMETGAATGPLACMSSGLLMIKHRPHDANSPLNLSQKKFTTLREQHDQYTLWSVMYKPLLCWLPFLRSTTHPTSEELLLKRSQLPLLLPTCARLFICFLCDIGT
jgi:hypothetical protein